MKISKFRKWWTTKRRWNKDVEKYFNANTPEERYQRSAKCHAGIKKMCEAAYKAGQGSKS